MDKHSEPDQTLTKMPSLRAVKSFVAAAKYQSFTRAAEALCVTQAAISKRIRELEVYLGTELFIRSGRTVKLCTLWKAAAGSATLITQPPSTWVALSGNRPERRNATPIARHARTSAICCMEPAF